MMPAMRGYNQDLAQLQSPRSVRHLKERVAVPMAMSPTRVDNVYLSNDFEASPTNTHRRQARLNAKNEVKIK